MPCPSFLPTAATLWFAYVLVPDSKDLDTVSQMTPSIILVKRPRPRNPGGNGRKGDTSVPSYPRLLKHVQNHLPTGFGQSHYESVNKVTLWVKTLVMSVGVADGKGLGLIMATEWG